MLKPGYLLDGKYRVKKVLGRGGMSTVYLVINERANKHWAVKEIRKDVSLKQELLRRSLIDETEILKNLRHPGLPRVIDVIDHEDSLLLVMDYILGDTLEDLLKRSGPLPECQVLNWAKQILEVLSYLHSRNPPVIYLDLKPDNIMLRPDGRVVLIDFGTARILQEKDEKDKASLGTKGYAAPEQYDSASQIDARTDIYCLGATLFCLLTGHEISDNARDQELRDKESALSDGFGQVIGKCTRTDQNKRYQSCDEVMHDLLHLEEFDRSFRNRQALRLKIFIASCLMTVFLGICVCVTGAYYHFLIRQDYLAYLHQALAAQDLVDMDKMIHKAVSLDPGNPQAYLGMLSWISADNLMTDREKTAMESLLYEKQKGRQNIVSFRRHKNEYARFCYDMGIACFFYYRGSRGKSIAAMWFEESRSYPLSKGREKRAEIYGRIGSYYTALLSGGRTGEDRKQDYGTFFRDLEILCRYSPEEMGNPAAALTLYSEIADQIGTHARDFLDFSDNTPARLKNILTRLRTYAGSAAMDKAENKDMENLLMNIDDAQIKIDAAIKRMQ